MTFIYGATANSEVLENDDEHGLRSQRRRVSILSLGLIVSGG